MLSLILLSRFCWAQSSSNNSPSFKLNGQVEVLTNFVEKGLTQTETDPSIQGSFLFNFGPQFSMGFWASNTNFPNDNTHLWTKLLAQVKIPISMNFETKIKYSQDQYYKENNHNGNVIDLEFSIFKYIVTYEMVSNWEATSQSSTHVSLQKVIDVMGNSWKWDNLVGYNMLKATDYSSYFNYQTFLGRKFSDFYLQGGLTGTSSASQFNGRGDYFVVVKASVGF